MKKKSAHESSQIDESNAHMDYCERSEHNQDYFYNTRTPPLIALIEITLKQSSPGHQRYIKAFLWDALNAHLKNPDKTLGYEYEPVREAGRRDRYGRFIGYGNAEEQPPKRDSKGRFVSSEAA